MVTKRIFAYLPVVLTFSVKTDYELATGTGEISTRGVNVESRMDFCKKKKGNLPIFTKYIRGHIIVNEAIQTADNEGTTENVMVRNEVTEKDYLFPNNTIHP
ncbi:MAG: hypothetical protein LBC47_01450 [Tannerella sp.]|nr:hypothetical protein [Tannerella sp.]